jgi:hypothetical protein
MVSHMCHFVCVIYASCPGTVGRSAVVVRCSPSIEQQTNPRPLTLSPTPLTSSVEQYRMSMDILPWSKLVGKAQAGSSAGAGPSLEGVGPAIASQPDSEYAHLIRYTDNALLGLSQTQVDSMLEKCNHCSLFFSPEALRYHITSHAGSK